MKPLVSVVVPIYKVEKYLEKCINSIMNQTYPNLEIILVDDGSPDRCGEICEKYKLIDSRITVVHKENQGLGLARNSGLEKATGEYVVFIDSDDWVSENYVEGMMKVIEDDESDLVISGHIRENQDGRIIKEIPPSANNSCFCDKDVIENVLLPVLGAPVGHKSDIAIEMSVCTNLYRVPVIKSKGLQFVSEREYLSEDLFFNIDYIMNCKRVSLDTACNYHYKFNEVSLTNSYRPQRFTLLTNLYKKEIEILKEYGMLESTFQRVNRTFIMKARNAIKSLVNSKNVKFACRYKALKEFLNNEIMCHVLKTYPIETYGLSLKVPAILMKHKLCLLLWLEEKMRYIAKTLESKLKISKKN